MCISNGTIDPNTGGLKMDGSSNLVEPTGPTGVGDCRIYDSLISKNMGSQIVLTGSGGNYRVFGLTVVGTQIETGGLTGLSSPLLKADCADRVAFISCNFAAAQQSIRCVSLGGGNSTQIVEDVTFSSCHFGFNSSANPAVLLLSYTNSANFIDMRHGGTGTKLIDASALSLGSPAQYKVLASAMPPIKAADVTDPQGVIRVPTLQAPV
ncbi:hypothetical protein WQQ_30000 [Hydrocarboniphaga effusa AP103]|uniref:Uncharacterized protein n=1 Tax=Hydrocarboniphaga effusa AP103 TaxID=1172194 RepID=I8T6Q7_9GAMM|nr:hypothetical protein WQQ_30000 [Hydrocarboniphaga effusa AP103]